MVIHLFIYILSTAAVTTVIIELSSCDRDPVGLQSLHLGTFTEKNSKLIMFNIWKQYNI